jgi:hypothetical protein
MVGFMVRSQPAGTPTGLDPARIDGRRWPLPVMLGLALGGFLSPLVCFAGAGTAFALADQEQAILLAGVGVMHMILSLTLLGGL